MAGTSEVLQEYLVSLGFKTDMISLRKFEDSLGTTGKKVLNFGMGVAGVVAGVEAAAAAFAYSMRKNFFAADLSNSTVQHIQALDYAGKQFGITADTMESSVHALATSFALNPGMVAYANNLTGISNAGRDTTDVMLDLVKAVKTKFPDDWVGAKVMEQFGMGADEYRLMSAHIDEVIKKRKEAIELQQRYGIDMDKQRAVTMAYAESIDKLELRFTALSQTLLTRLLPAFAESTKALGTFMDALILSIQEPDPTNAPQRWWEKLLGIGNLNSNEDAELKKQWQGQGQGVKPSVTVPTRLAELEKGHNLSKGLLDNIWRVESSRGRNMLSSAGAKGPFQFEDKTAAQWGVSDPNDFSQSSEGAAKMMEYLIRKYKGDSIAALRAYNWGEGNMDAFIKTGRGLKGQPMPIETLYYPEKVLGEHTKLGDASPPSSTVNSNVVINVTGTDAQSTAKAVAGQQSRVLGDAVRFSKVPMQ